MKTTIKILAMLISAFAVGFAAIQIAQYGGSLIPTGEWHNIVAFAWYIVAFFLFIGPTIWLAIAAGAVTVLILNAIMGD